MLLTLFERLNRSRIGGFRILVPIDFLLPGSPIKQNGGVAAWPTPPETALVPLPIAPKYTTIFRIVKSRRGFFRGIRPCTGCYGAFWACQGGVACGQAIRSSGPENGLGSVPCLPAGRLSPAKAGDQRDPMLSLTGKHGTPALREKENGRAAFGSPVPPVPPSSSRLIVLRWTSPKPRLLASAPREKPHAAHGQQGHRGRLGREIHVRKVCGHRRGICIFTVARKKTDV